MPSAFAETAALPTAEDEPGKDHQAILDHLRRTIVDHHMPPGSRLREHSLAEQFGVSRARIREVLAALEQTGLIEREPNRERSSAVPPRPSCCRSSMSARCWRGFAPGSPPRTCRRNPWEDLVELSGAPTEALVENADVAGYLHNHGWLRQRMLEAARNPVLTASLQPLTDRTGMVMRRLLLMTNRMRDALHEHRAILAAMRRGDADEAERLKRIQIRSARTAVERYHAYLL